MCWLFSISIFTTLEIHKPSVVPAIIQPHCSHAYLEITAIEQLWQCFSFRRPSDTVKCCFTHVVVYFAGCQMSSRSGHTGRNGRTGLYCFNLETSVACSAQWNGTSNTIHIHEFIIKNRRLYWDVSDDILDTLC